MKVSELEGELLDYWVGRAEGWTFGPPHKILECDVWRDSEGRIAGIIPARAYQPSSEWEHGGPIIERECIALDPLERGGRSSKHWQAQIWTPYAVQHGDTPLIAAMRAYVASEYGETVPDDEE